MSLAADLSLNFTLRRQSGMTDIRAKIRELIASGVLTKDRPPITRPEPWSTPGNKRSKVFIGGPLHESCTICAEPGPQVRHFYIVGHVVSVHTPCDALWKQERSPGGASDGD